MPYKSTLLARPSFLLKQPHFSNVASIGTSQSPPTFLFPNHCPDKPLKCIFPIKPQSCSALDPLQTRYRNRYRYRNFYSWSRDRNRQRGHCHRKGQYPLHSYRRHHQSKYQSTFNASFQPTEPTRHPGRQNKVVRLIIIHCSLG